MGWLAQPVRIVKSKWPKKEFLFFGLILGGEATTLGRVSRMEVREGTMGLPVIVLSQ